MKNQKTYTPRLIAWEVTRRCHLKCKHCRAEAADRPYPGEFSTEEIKKTMDNIASISKPIIILTGGEPMTRDDIFEITSYGDSLGLKMVMAPCGALVTHESVEKMKKAGIKRISLSIDGATAKSHDDFRGVDGTFDDIIRAAKVAKEAGLSFQINTTVTKINLHELPDILALATNLGADSFHPFLLVPTGRGKDLRGLELKPQEYEDTLRWIHDATKSAGIHVKPTCAPHYYRITEELGDSKPVTGGHPGLNTATRGCLGGIGFAFISHIGKVQMCGFMDMECGDVREEDYNFNKIWNESDIFNRLRDPEAYIGKCGFCNYHDICGGCRARAFAATGNYLTPEPYCVYVPQKSSHSRLSARLRINSGRDMEVQTGNFSDMDKKILTNLQSDFPITPKPFKELAASLGIAEGRLVEKIDAWKKGGIIRHLSAHINTNKIGFQSALIAIKTLPDRVDSTADIIALYPGVSHNYMRKHEYNIWFTIQVPKPLNLKKHVEKIANKAGVLDFLILPSKKTYKLNVRFDLTGMKSPSRPSVAYNDDGAFDLSDSEETIIETLNLGLPIDARPFKELAGNLGLTEEAVCGVVSDLKKKGIVRKLRVVLNHMNVGIKSNAMVVWDIDPEKVENAGRVFAGKEFISHCYERARFDRFPYNVYTMIHAGSPEELNQLIGGLKAEVSPKLYCKLVTARELFKRKTTIIKKSYLKWEEID